MISPPGRVPLFEILSRLPQRAAELPAVVAALPAQALVAQCARHGLSAWVAEGLGAAGAPLPDAAQRQLTADAQRLVSASLKNRRLLHAVLDALAAEGVVPVLLKGYGLAVRLYPQPLGRPATDVDVLVQPEQLPAVRRVLGARGLAERHDEGLADVFEEHHHLGFAGAAGLVEVHFRLFTGFGGGCFDDRGLWSRARPAQLDGRAVRYLAPEDEFLYLAVHAANHAFLRLSWLVDLQRFLATQPPLDWAVVAQRAREAGFSRALAAALRVLAGPLEVPLPPGASSVQGDGSHGVHGDESHPPGDESHPPHGERSRTVHGERSRTIRGSSAPSTPLGVNGARLGSAAAQAVERRLFSPEHLVEAGLAEGRLSNFLVRLWLVDDLGSGLRHLLDGARRAVRRRRWGG